MKLLSIISDKTLKCSNLLEQACQKYGVEYKVQDIRDDFSDTLDTKAPTFVYRLSDTTRAHVFEANAIYSGFNSFYRHPDLLKLDWDNVLDASLLHKMKDIPIPRTIFTCPKGKAKLLECSEYLGFPLIIKITGGQKGIGVLKVDSLEALVSVVDYLHAENKNFILREFIFTGEKPISHRAIVLGDEVIFSYRNQSIDSGEFRSNVNQEKRSRVQISMKDEEKKACIKAAHAVNVNVAGVDFLYDKEGKISILEVNFPFNFSPIVEDFSFPVHEKMVEFMLQSFEH